MLSSYLKFVLTTFENPLQNSFQCEQYTDYTFLKPVFTSMEGKLIEINHIKYLKAALKI